jgi:hypothetical protein
MKGRIDDIEVLRAIAVIYVCIEHMHMNLFAWVGGPLHTTFFGWTGMWSGVDLRDLDSDRAQSFLAITAADSTHERLVTTLAFGSAARRLIPRRGCGWL